MNNETGGGERERASASPNKDPAHRPWSMKALFVSVVNARPLNFPVYSKEKKKKGKEEGGGGVLPLWRISPQLPGYSKDDEWKDREKLSKYVATQSFVY